MRKFKVGDLIEVIKELPQDKHWGIMAGMRGEIKDIDKNDNSRYIVDFLLYDKKKIPMLESQMEHFIPGSPNDAVDSSLYAMQEYLTPGISIKLSQNDFKILNPIKKYNEKEKNNMEILDLYKKRKNFKIQNDYLINKNKILEEDEIQKIFKEMIEQVNVILENEGSKPVDMELPVQYKEFRTAKTNEKLNELDADTDKLKDKLYSDYEEIKAMLSMTIDYQEQIKILKNYGIIDKKTNKLSV